MTADVRGIPATAYTGSVGSLDRARLTPDILLVFVTLWYFAITWLDVVLHIRAMRVQKRRKSLVHVDDYHERHELRQFVLMTQKNRWGTKGALGAWG